MITVVIGKLINGVVVLGRSYYSGSGWYNDDGSFYIWVCCNDGSLYSRFYGILESHQKGSLSNETKIEVMKQDMPFLGNASSVISAERRCHMADYHNYDLYQLTEEQERFQNAPPFLFGKDFERAARDHVESIKCLRKLAVIRSGAPNPSFFRQDRPYNQIPRECSRPYRKSSHGKIQYQPYHSTGKENYPRKGKTYRTETSL